MFQIWEQRMSLTLQQAASQQKEAAANLEQTID
jgi:hypothetical protein